MLSGYVCSFTIASSCSSFGLIPIDVRTLWSSSRLMMPSWLRSKDLKRLFNSSNCSGRKDICEGGILGPVMRENGKKMLTFRSSRLPFTLLACLVEFAAQPPDWTAHWIGLPWINGTNFIGFAIEVGALHIISLCYRNTTSTHKPHWASKLTSFSTDSLYGYLRRSIAISQASWATHLICLITIAIGRVVPQATESPWG